MLKLKKQIDKYLEDNFLYDASIDQKALDYSKTLGEYEDGRWNFKPRVNLHQCIVNNLNYKMLLPEMIDTADENQATSFLKLAYDYEFIDSLKVNEKVYEMIMNITDDEVEKLLAAKIDIDELIYLTLFVLRKFPDSDTIHDIVDFEYREYCSGNEPIEIKLSNPLHEFKELKLIYAIKDKFHISNNQILKVLGDNFNDYATYSIGGYNSDYREEFMMYYEFILKPYILS